MLSVVVPAYNEEKDIVKLLESLKNQETKQKFEVILVDNNCTDKTVEEARKFEEVLDLRIVKESKKGRSPARHKGFSVAKGKIILSTDADVEVPSNWLDELSKHLAYRGVVAVTSNPKLSGVSSLDQKIFDLSHHITRLVYRVLFGHFWMNGFSFAVKRDDYLRSGGFDKELNALEDVDLSFKIHKLGKIKYLKSAPVKFSARRYENVGLIKGLLSYPATFWHYFRGKKDKVVMSDER